MRCISCKIEVPSSFTHAFQKNECPACGDQLLDEESIALLDDLKKSITNEIRLREESAAKLALMLVTSYSISKQHKFSKEFKEEKEDTKNLLKGINIEEERHKLVEELKKDKIEEKLLKKKEERVRQEIYEKTLEEHYGSKMIKPTSVISKEKIKELENNPDFHLLKNQMSKGLNDLSGSSILEEDRRRRLAKQQENILSGNSKVKRSG